MFLDRWDICRREDLLFRSALKFSEESRTPTAVRTSLFFWSTLKLSEESSASIEMSPFFFVCEENRATVLHAEKFLS